MKLSARNVGGWCLANFLILSGFVSRATNKLRNRENILAICFHKPSKQEFESCVRWLIKNKFVFLSVPELDKIIHQGLPIPKGTVVLTVDDGWQSNEANVVAVANKYEVPVAIYIATEAVEEGVYWWSYIQEAGKRRSDLPSKQALKTLPNEERLRILHKIKQEVAMKREAMTIEQVKRIARSNYITIGCHTHSHPILPNCSTAQVYEELQVSRQKLESWIGKEVPYFAYPNGDYGQREIMILSELNFRLAFSIQRRCLTSDRLQENFNLPRFGFLEEASFAENICRMVGIWQPLMLWLKPFSAKKMPEHQVAASRPYAPYVSSGGLTGDRGGL
jgi:poly-beta-1,6-N-acetyl-D-glucosamine N-deacetylase